MGYAGRKYNVYGENPVEATKIDMIMDGVEDWRIAYVKVSGD